MTSEELRARLVRTLRSGGLARDPRVATAMSEVPRHVFLPGTDLEEAYRDTAVVTRRDASGTPTSSASQPAIVAVMLDQLAAAPGHRVLEIGAGTGYNAALLARIVGPAGHVTTVDIQPDVVAQARDSLAAAGLGDVEVVCGDGGLGYAGNAPYDRVVVTAGAWDLPPAWADQTVPGGTLVVPLRIRGSQRCVTFERTADAGEVWTSRSVTYCGFMRLQGAFGDPGRHRTAAAGITLGLDDDRLDDESTARLLAVPGAETPTGVAATPAEVAEGLASWLDVVVPGACGVHAMPDAVAEARAAAVPLPLITTPAGRGFGVAVATDSALAALSGTAPERDEETFPLTVRGYGPDPSEPVERLRAAVRAWDAAGRPDASRMRIRAYPRSTPDADLPAGHVLDRDHTRLLVTFGP